MTLKIELKPNERIIIGDCVIRNDDQRTRLYINGDTPVLREKDILKADEATSPAKRLYLAVQLMYLDGMTDKNKEVFDVLVDQILDAAPSMTPYVEEIQARIKEEKLYKAMKEAKHLIEYEDKLLKSFAA